MPRTRRDGTVGYTAQIRIRRVGGAVAHSETKTFDRKGAAQTWLRKREKELDDPGAIKAAKIPDPALAAVIDGYIDKSERDLGRTKAQVLRSIRDSDLGRATCSATRTCGRQATSSRAGLA